MLPVSLGPTGSGSGMGSSAKVAVTSTLASGMVKVTLVGSSASGVFRKVSAFCSSPPTSTVQLMKCCPSGTLAVRCTILFFGTGTVLSLGTDASLPSMVAVTWSPTLRVGFRVGLLAKFAVTSTFLLGIVKVALVGSFLSGVRKVSAFCSSSPTFTVQPMKCCPSGTVAVRCTLVSAATGASSTSSSSFAVTFSPVVTVYSGRT